MGKSTVIPKKIKINKALKEEVHKLNKKLNFILLATTHPK